MASHCLTSHAGSALPARSPASVRLGEMSLSSGPGARANLAWAPSRIACSSKASRSCPSAGIRDRPGRGRPVSAPFQAGFSAPAYRAGIPGPGDRKEISQKRGQSMSRFRKALAAAAMAVATAGGGLLATAAAAAPAHAATPAGGHTTTGFTAVPAAQAPGGIGPKFQCGDTCDPNGGGNPPPPPPRPQSRAPFPQSLPGKDSAGRLFSMPIPSAPATWPRSPCRRT